VFFVGFMGSLTVYLGKWGVSQAPFLQSRDPGRDREPTYLFIYAPTSFGWRDLMLSKSQFSRREQVITPSGVRTERYSLSEDYKKNLSWSNHAGAYMVSAWIYIVFLLVLGFAYSFFWTASTIIYLLMRQKVDDTEIDEVHLEEAEEEPFTPPTPAASTTGVKPASTNAGVTMVEPPQLRTTTTPGPTIVTPATSGATTGDVPEPPRPDGSSGGSENS
jgi:hypothetical protein